MPERRSSVSPEPRRRRSDFDDHTSRDQGHRRRRDTEHEHVLSHAPGDTTSADIRLATGSRSTPRRRQSSRDRERGYFDRHSSSSSTQTPLSPLKHRMSASDSARRIVSSPPIEKREARPYPTFSKAHSRESVTKENIPQPRTFPFTPDHTEVNASVKAGSSPRASNYRTSADARPPSPPLTATSSGNSKRGSNKRFTISPTTPTDSYSRSYDDLPQRSDRLRPSKSDIVLQEAEEGRSKVEVKIDAATPPSQKRRSSPTIHKDSRQGTPTRSEAQGQRQHAGTAGCSSRTDSDATIPANPRDSLRPPTLVPHHDDPSSHSSTGSSPHTPHLPDRHFDRQEAVGKHDADIEVFMSEPPPSSFPPPLRIPSTTLGPPPPPPPPDFVPQEVPRVDYLLLNGGLPQLIPRSFSAAANSASIQSYQQYMSPQPTGTDANPMSLLFAPYEALLQDIEKVLSMNGSVAVATGYRSVARRLLDRLEHIFARNISSELCPCRMCISNHSPTKMSPEDTGVSWGEVLELVSGRKELPSWPPFSLANQTPGNSHSNGQRLAKPMQTLDVDIPEEYREHYIRQSQKTKSSVQKWLASQPEEHVEAPSEADDETLAFAILTCLDPTEKSTFENLMRDAGIFSSSRSATPAHSQPVQQDFITRVGVALQRLYRLSKSARSPESAVYLIRNPHLHNVLATLAAISDPEWDILISGRFDGFLWSGAEDPVAPFSSASTASPSPAASRGTIAPSVSRTNTPFTSMTSTLPPHGTVPFPASTPTVSSTGSNTAWEINPGAPVQMDEDTEIAVLAEMEREIFSGMDALEDAFHALHIKAETVRTALRNRGAGLAIQARARRGFSDVAATRGGTPGIGVGDSASRRGTPWSDFDGDDDNMSDVMSLAPDDSASNIGWRDRESRRQRDRERDREKRRDDRHRGMAPPVAEKKRRGFLGLGIGGRKVDVVREEE